MYPEGILTNQKTGRFHPIVFRYSPPPGEFIDTGPQRYKSLGHHTEGFDNLDDAKAYITGNAELNDTGAHWEWDGEEVPALVCWF